MKRFSVSKAVLLAAFSVSLVGTQVNSFAVDSKVDGLTTASLSSTQFVNDLFSRQWVARDASGNITGSVVGLSHNTKVPVAELPVYLVKNGEVVLKTVSDKDGKFSLEKVNPGSYSLVVRGPESIGAFSLHVLESPQGQHLTSDVEVRVVAPSVKVNEILDKQTVPAFASRIHNPVDLSRDPIESIRTFGQSQAVRADDFGRLVGRIGSPDQSQDLSDMTVYVFKDDEQVAKAPVSATGDYAVEGLKPGVYGFVAIGETGFAATSFEFVSSAASPTGANGEKLVGLFKNACRGMNIECVPCPEVTVCEVTTEVVHTEKVVAVEEPCGEVLADECGVAPNCGCGFGGGYGYGGGGGGGGFHGGGMGGGWAGLAGIAGLATVAAILADDNNDGSAVVSK